MTVVILNVHDGTEFDTNTHAQMDCILINDRWKIPISNIALVHETILDSDHALLIPDVHVKLAHKKRVSRSTCSHKY